MRNLSLKIISLAVAILLFRFVNSEANTSLIELVIPVEVRNPPKDAVLVSPHPAQARVSLRGPTALVARIATAPPTFRVSWPVEAGKQYVASLRAEMLSLPPYVQVQRIEPSEIEFNFDKLATRELPLRVPRLGDVAPGLRLEGFIVDPMRASIHGPEGEVQQLEALETSPVELPNVPGEFEREVVVRVPSAVSEVTPRTARVAGRIVSIEKRVLMKDLTIEIRSAVGAKDVSIEPQTVTLELSGPITRMDELSADDVVPYVRLRRESSFGAQLPVALDLPPGIHLVALEPKQVRVVVAHGAVGKDGKRKERRE